MTEERSYDDMTKEEILDLIEEARDTGNIGIERFGLDLLSQWCEVNGEVFAEVLNTP